MGEDAEGFPTIFSQALRRKGTSKPWVEAIVLLDACHEAALGNRLYPIGKMQDAVNKYYFQHRSL